MSGESGGEVSRADINSGRDATWRHGEYRLELQSMPGIILHGASLLYPAHIEYSQCIKLPNHLTVTEGIVIYIYIGCSQG